MATGLPGVVVTETFCATGAWFVAVAVTVIDTVAVLLSAFPSFALNVKPSDPEYPATGEYVTNLPLPDKLPWAGFEQL